MVDGYARRPAAPADPADMTSRPANPAPARSSPPHRAATAGAPFAVLLTAMLAPMPASAQDLTAEEIAAAVGDRTYQGSMTADAFAEYYAADGTIRGDGYAGTWRAGPDSLCFAYGDAAEQCWSVLLNGPALTLVKDGEVDGSGMLVDGNPLGL